MREELERCDRWAYRFPAIVLGGLVAVISVDARAQEILPAPPPSSPDEVPRAPGAVAPAKTLEQVTFSAAVSRAVSKNPTAVTANEEIARVRALMEQVRSVSLPTLGATGVYTRLDADRMSNGVVVNPKSALNLSLGLNVPIITPRGWTQWGQAGDQIDVARANALDVRRTIAVATARAYLTVIAQKRILETAKIARDAAKAHYEFTHAQRVGGVGNKLDELRAAQELTTDEVNVQNQNVALVRAREALGVLVAGDGAMDVASDDIAKDELPVPAGDAMEGIDNNRADIRARRRAAEATDRRVRQAWADYLPSLSAQATPFYENPATAAFPETGWQAQLILSLPLYDGGLRYGQEHERESLAVQAKEALESTQRQARSDTRLALEEVQRADLALEQARQSAAFGKKVLELALIAYKAGATSNLEVIDAERQARDTEAAAVIAEDNARQARLDLLAASGRFP